MIAEVRKELHRQGNPSWNLTFNDGIAEIGGLYSPNNFISHSVFLTEGETAELMLKTDQLWMDLRDFTKFQVMTYLINKLLKEKQMYKFDGTLYKIVDGHAYFQDPDFGWSPSLFSAEEVEKHFEKYYS